ncbi:MAG: hypothetical protein LBU76_00605 [Azoarcus sp.]|nr:hypothetical protein [Azoarcus sp.]
MSLHHSLNLGLACSYHAICDQAASRAAGECRLSHSGRTLGLQQKT